MIRRNKRYIGVNSRNASVIYTQCQTSQLEPNLREILVKYSRGEDVSDYIRMPATKATAEQQFTNRIGKVDPLTEMQDYVKEQTLIANQAVESDCKKASSKQVVKPSDQSEQPSQS